MEKYKRLFSTVTPEAEIRKHIAAVSDELIFRPSNNPVDTALIYVLEGPENKKRVIDRLVKTYATDLED